MKLYMFRTVPLSIIRSFSQYTQQWYMSYRFADSLRAGSGWNCSSWNETQRVSDSSSVHHQEFFTAHTAMVYVIQVCWQLASKIRMELQLLEWNSTCFGQFLCPSSGVFRCTHNNGICHTGLLTGCEQDQDGTAVTSWSCSQAVSKPVWHIPLLCVLWKTPDDGHRNCPKRVEFHSKNKYEKLVHLVGFIIRNLLRCTVTWTSNLCITIHWPNRVHHTVYTKSHSPVSTTTPCGVHRHDHHGAPSNCNVFVTHKTVTKTCWPLVSYKIVVFQTQKHNFVNP